MRKDRTSILKILSRSLRLRCPACGQASIVSSLFHIKNHCSSCDVLFMREDGFFVGAIMANVIATEFVILVVYVVSLPVFGAHYRLVLTILFLLAVLFPPAFYHHSWGLWLGFDHLVESLPRVPATKRL